jgi:hypothetical protein
MRAICLPLAVIAGCFSLTQASLAEEACVAVPNGIMCGQVVSPDQPLRRSLSPPPKLEHQSEQSGAERGDHNETDQRSDQRDQDHREEPHKLSDDRRESRMHDRCDRRGGRTEECRYAPYRQRLGRSEERRTAEQVRNNRPYREWLTRQRQGCGCGEWRYQDSRGPRLRERDY